jgi:hypothetical protein
MSQNTTEPPTEERPDVDGGETESGAASLSRDDAYHLLQNKRRRAVLRHVLAHDRTEYVMREVAEAVAAWEHDTTVERLASTERQRVYISLYQSHLPKLAEHGIIDYDQPRGRITVQPLAQVLAPILDVDDGLDAPETIRVERDDRDGGADREESTTGKGLLSRLGLD